MGTEMNTTIVSFATNQGRRKRLEDAFGISKIVLPLLYDITATMLTICDGVGGNVGGDVASRAAVDSIASSLAAHFVTSHRDAVLRPDSVSSFLTESLEQANRDVLHLASGQSGLQGMATAAVCAVIVNDRLHVSWVGDSRCYHYHNGNLEQITVDHSEVQALVDAGLIQSQQAKSHPLSHTINRFLGQAGDFNPDARTCRLWPQDVILLCSDGLTDVLTDARIAHRIRTCQNAEFEFRGLSQRLVDEALAAGTSDNVTVLCCENCTQPHMQHLEPDLTWTGSYPLRAADTLHRLCKEHANV